MAILQNSTIKPRTYICNMYLVKTPKILKPIAHKLTWNKSRKERILYLTFDDGPIPEVTPWVIQTLAQHNAQGTFFLVGENAARSKELVKNLLEAGHSIGNHTHNHMNGWKTQQYTYLKNTLEATQHISSNLFRPPYGRISRRQALSLTTRFEVVMWDVLSGDFDEQIDGETCYHNVIKHAKAGSIIVFHDSIKAFPRLKEALPRILNYFAEKEYRFSALPMQELPLENHPE